MRLLLLTLLAVPLLGACVNDIATYEIDGSREHTLSLVRQQQYFWNDKVDLHLVVSRMPNCTRRHDLGGGTPNTRVEIWQVPSGAFIVRVGKRLYATETRTCESFARIEGEPATGMGEMKGVFRVGQGKLTFAREAVAGDEGAE
ncbi:MAG: hypothetical protein FWF20_05245 [Betaproteobacteria bacterium]|nr:hypothetical protein [Betaproteobacteria bacterium]MCL2886176.1 hypothetical protein [Betaproteobacteria bacterium]